MPAIHHHLHVVHPDEIDEQGHAGNVAFVQWMQDAAIAHSAAQGWPGERYRRERSAWVVRSHAIEYRGQAFAGDEIVVRTWVSNFRKVTSLRKYRIERVADGAVLAIAETDWAFLDTDRGAPQRIPREVAEAFEIVPPENQPGLGGR
ncbi:MAG: acyl-CoA thioesterase [Planctomycetales bacterium]